MHLPVAKKAKTIPVGNLQSFHILLLAKEVLFKINECLLPVDVVNLCSSSKVFHCHCDELLKGTLAKTLLHFSLLQSLDRVLARSKCGFTVETFKKMAAELEPGSLKISGSAMVQTALGLPFAKKSDVDLCVFQLVLLQQLEVG